MARLDKLIDSVDGRVAVGAIKLMLEWAYGSPPKAPLIRPEDVPTDKAALQAAVETRLAQAALEGDPRAMLPQLQALDPERYRPTGDVVDEDPPTSLSFSRLAPGEVPPRPSEE